MSEWSVGGRNKLPEGYIYDGEELLNGTSFGDYIWTLPPNQFSDFFTVGRLR